MAKEMKISAASVGTIMSSFKMKKRQQLTDLQKEKRNILSFFEPFEELHWCRRDNLFRRNNVYDKKRNSILKSTEFCQRVQMTSPTLLKDVHCRQKPLSVIVWAAILKTWSSSLFSEMVLKSLFIILE